MSSLAGTVMGVRAACSFNAATPAFFIQRGFQTFVKNGVGDYTFTLSQGGVNMQTQGVVQATVQAAVGAYIITANPISATQLRVTITDADGITAIDTNFWLTIWEIGPN